MILNKGLIFKAALAFVLCSTAWASATSAVAATRSYDGSWNLIFVTRSGDCDPSYNFTVNINGGVITHPNLVRFRGNVSPSGAARASVRVGDRSASGTGRLQASSGGGSWIGYSGTGRCSGNWRASRN